MRENRKMLPLWCEMLRFWGKRNEELQIKNEKGKEQRAVKREEMRKCLLCDFCFLEGILGLPCGSR
jgi:hypothetical protein